MCPVAQFGRAFPEAESCSTAGAFTHGKGCGFESHLGILVSHVIQVRDLVWSRIPPCHGGSREFKSRRICHMPREARIRAPWLFPTEEAVSDTKSQFQRVRGANAL